MTAAAAVADELRHRYPEARDIRPAPSRDGGVRLEAVFHGGGSVSGSPDEVDAALREAIPVEMPKYLRVVSVVQALIEDGTLRAGDAVPAGAELARMTQCCPLTALKALAVLVRDGALVRGASPGSRPRVPPAHPGGRGRGDRAGRAARALSAGLAARRLTAGLTQAQLGERIGYSPTAVGHAETARLWHGLRFWDRADTALGAGGELLRLHDAYAAARSPEPGRKALG